MRRRRLLWQLYPSYLLVVLLALAATTWFFVHTLRDFYFDQERENLRARAELLIPLLRDRLEPGQEAWVDRVCRDLGDRTGSRFTVILPSGEVLGDSRKDPERMESHADRPEVVEALRGGIGDATRYSSTLERTMLYVALPLKEGEEVTGVVRAAVGVTAMEQTLREVYREAALGGLAAVVLTALLSLTLSRRLSRPLEQMKEGAERFARGDLDRPLAVQGSDEMRGLAEAMNLMAAQLSDRIRTVLQQRNEQEAVLSSMVEGVLAVDREERILRLNRAAAKLLNLAPDLAQGRRIQEVIRKADLQRFVSRALAAREAVEGDIALRGEEGEKHLQAHGSPLRDGSGREIGALIVLNDVTRLRRLESLRRDFVANVSHELKTPITAIKGFVETLLEGAVHQPEDAERFLRIITKQAERLNAIIDDLLALSRIEQEAEKQQIPLREASLEEVARASAQSCSVAASARSIRVEVSCPEPLQARINPPLLEQALTNLVDNAIKYSPPGSRVAVEVQAQGREARIAVRDRGCGIPAEHLPRLFERFYRVDKARSRKQGGTGLGLAIVKHIVQAHGGRVEVESTPGEGSLFTIVLPLP